MYMLCNDISAMSISELMTAVTYSALAMISVHLTYLICRAKKFREALQKKHDMDPGLAMIVKQRGKPGEIEKMDLVGSVQGCDAIIGRIVHHDRAHDALYRREVPCIMW